MPQQVSLRQLSLSAIDTLARSLCLWKAAHTGEYLAAHVASTYKMPVAPSSLRCDNQKGLQILPNVCWGEHKIVPSFETLV